MSMQIQNMISKPFCIKDLIILQEPKIFKSIKSEINIAKNYNVSILDLPINSYIYAKRVGDIAFIINYIKVLKVFVEFFGNLFYDEIYTLKIENYLDDNCYNEIINRNIFYNIFCEMNNQFNILVSDECIFESLFVYGDEISLEIIYCLYSLFNDKIISTLNPYVDNKILLKYNAIRTVRIYPHLYDDIIKKIENLYLPFY